MNGRPHPTDPGIDVNLACRAVGQRLLNVLICQIDDHSRQGMLMHPLDFARPNFRARNPNAFILKLKTPMFWIRDKRIGELSRRFANTFVTIQLQAKHLSQLVFLLFACSLLSVV